jgi:hypothetical protein
MIKKNSNVKLYASLGALAIVSIFAVVGITNAWSGTSDKVVVLENGDYIEAPAPQFQEAGVAAGPDIYQHLNLHAGLTTGGVVYATDTTATTFTLTNTEVGGDIFSLEVVPINSITLTLPASSTMYGLIPNVGDTRRYYIHNYSTTTNTVTVAAGDTMLLQYATDTLAFNASTTMVIDFTRVNAWDNGSYSTSSADIVGIIDVFGPAY